MNRMPLAAALAGATLLLGAAGAQAAIVISGNFCSVAPVDNPFPGSNAGGHADEAVGLATLGGQWMNDFTSPFGYAASDSSAGTGADDRPGAVGANLYSTTAPYALPAGVSVTWSAALQDNHDARPDPIGTRQNEMFAGYLFTQKDPVFGGSGTITLSASGLSSIYALGYSINLFIDGEHNIGSPEITTYSVSDGTTTYYGRDDSTFFTSPVFTQVTSTTAGVYTSGNYVTFSGLTGDSFTITLQGIERGMVLNGFEIVGVPVPAPLALLAAGLLGLGATRRQRAA